MYLLKIYIFQYLHTKTFDRSKVIHLKENIRHKWRKEKKLKTEQQKRMNGGDSTPYPTSMLTCISYMYADVVWNHIAPEK